MQINRSPFKLLIPFSPFLSWYRWCRRSLSSDMLRHKFNNLNWNPAMHLQERLTQTANIGKAYRCLKNIKINDKPGVVEQRSVLVRIYTRIHTQTHTHKHTNSHKYTFSTYLLGRLDSCSKEASNNHPVTRKSPDRETRWFDASLSAYILRSWGVDAAVRKACSGTVLSNCHALAGKHKEGSSNVEGNDEVHGLQFVPVTVNRLFVCKALLTATRKSLAGR